MSLDSITLLILIARKAYEPKNYKEAIVDTNPDGEY